MNIYFLISYSSFIIFFLIMFILFNSKEKNYKVNEILKKNIINNEFYLVIYVFFYKFKLSRKILLKLKNRINLLNDASEKELRIITSKIFIFIYLPILVITFIMYFYIKKWYIYIFVVFVMINFINILIDYYFNKLKFALLNEMLDFNEILRRNYMNLNMIDEAFYESINELDSKKYKNIIRQVNKIYEMLIDSNSEMKLNEYYLIAPNRYLKLLAGIAFITKEYGEENNRSGGFSNSLSQISREIRRYILFNEKLNFALKSLNFIVIFPIFALNPLKLWGSKNFVPLANFYDSEYGFICEIIVIFSILLSFIFIKNIQNLSDNDIIVEKNNYKLLKKLYRLLHLFVDIFIPKERTKKYILKQRFLRKAMYYDDLKLYYTNKIIVGSIFLFMSIFISIIFNYNSLKSTLNVNLLMENNGNLFYKTENIISKEEEINFKNFIFKLSKMNVNDELEYIKLKLNDYNLDDNLKKKLIFNILNIVNEYNYKKFNYKYILLIYIISIFGYNLIDLFLFFRIRILKQDKNNEIMQFQTIISILMYISNIDVYEILCWFEKFSNVYKFNLQKAIMNYDSGQIEALEDLKKTVNNKEFEIIIDNLIIVNKDLELKDAFAELEIQKDYYYEKRKENDNRIVESKINIGKIIGFMPTYIFLVFYFMIPLIISSTKELNSYFNLLK